MSNRRRLPRDKHALVLDQHTQDYVNQLDTQAGPNRRNSYRCTTCNGTIVSVDIDPGVTPMMIRCYATEGCPGTAQSTWYRNVPDLAPTLEWYRPDTTKGQNSETVDHLRQGGLIHRPAQSAPDWVKAAHRGTR